MDNELKDPETKVMAEELLLMQRSMEEGDRAIRAEEEVDMVRLLGPVHKIDCES